MFDQAAGDWVAMHVSELLDALVVAEDVEVVVASKPERVLGGELGDGELEGLNGL
jgi:hypothetical protein